MDREQQERFAEAVERKNEDAQARGEAGNVAPGGRDEVAQESRTDASRGQDVDPREKSSRHGKVTADNWNQ
jgi:hypothetical protein